jgi:hypothetical protein
MLEILIFGLIYIKLMKKIVFSKYLLLYKINIKLP